VVVPHTKLVEIAASAVSTGIPLSGRSQPVFQGNFLVSGYPLFPDVGGEPNPNWNVIEEHKLRAIPPHGVEVSAEINAPPLFVTTVDLSLLLSSLTIRILINVPAWFSHVHPEWFLN